MTRTDEVLKVKPQTRVTYLGDSVYAELCNGELMLYTSNGMVKSNKIYMEREVWQALKIFMSDAHGKGEK